MRVLAASSNASMATTQGVETRIAPSKIRVQNSKGSLIRKVAELSDEEGKNKVTLACVRSLGHPTTTSAGKQHTEIELTWGPADGISTDEDIFEIVATATLARDFKLNDAASTRLLESRRGPSSFPAFPKKVKNGTQSQNHVAVWRTLT